MADKIIHKGLVIERVEGGWVWEDLEGLLHYDFAPNVPFRSVEWAKDDLDHWLEAHANG